ncbi:hypothetical protein [Sphingomonas adhaesiva]|uniref:hypothetical protein n=1 Tax=Sphingomonas adhaesiva TaxID=28212 RepID=UPI002FF515AD
MTLAALLATLPQRAADPAFPAHLLGAFRRHAITFCNGLTDTVTRVFWFQSRTFTIDLRLPDGAATPVDQRQGWIGDTLWDAAAGEMSWRIPASYQPHDQWPEAARLLPIGNSVIEIAPSGAYVEDWRQQAVRGPLLGLRLTAVVDTATGASEPREGGLIVAGPHIALAVARPSHRAAEMEAYEVSVALDGDRVTWSTQSARYGVPIVPGTFQLEPDGAVVLVQPSRTLRFVVDAHVTEMTFGTETPCTQAAASWWRREAEHLARHAVPLR